MNRLKHRDMFGETHAANLTRLLAELTSLAELISDPRELFSEFSRVLESHFDIRKGFLALRDGDQMRFLAVATWKPDGVRKNLSLRLPEAESFFAKVAATGQLYSENVAQFFDGNSIERRLLFDDDTVSFMLRPLKHDTELIGLLGYSSDLPDAFVTIQDGLIDEAFNRLAAGLHRLQSASATP